MSTTLLSFITIILIATASGMGLHFPSLCEDSGVKVNNGVWWFFMVLSILAFCFLSFSIFREFKKTGNMKSAMAGGKHSNMITLINLILLFIVGCIGWNTSNRCHNVNNENEDKVRGYNQFYVMITALSLGGIGIFLTKLHYTGGIKDGLKGKKSISTINTQLNTQLNQPDLSLDDLKL